MAKSPVGGSRAYLKGRIGSDVYSLGKDGKGKRQQVVRALAEEVANPRTSSQMFNRMIMSTVMQAVHELSPIIDHSFDGVAKGQPSISEFIRRNYPLVKADAIAHPSSGNFFGLNKYQEKGVRGGAYVIASGKVIVPSTIFQDFTACIFQLSADAHTVADLREAMGCGDGGYVTWVLLLTSYKAKYIRLHLNEALADDTVISAENVDSVFITEGNLAVGFEFSSNKVWVTSDEVESAQSSGLIISKKVNGSWQHSNATMKSSAGRSSTSDVALPTYPVGEEQFLNGGDI